MHYGVPKKSGRYPWGSGERPYQGDEVQQLTDNKRTNYFSYSKELNKATKNVRSKRFNSKNLLDGANRLIDVRSKDIAKRMIVNNESYEKATENENKKRMFIKASKIGLGILTGHPILTEIAVDVGVKTYDTGLDLYMYRKYKKQGTQIVQKYKSDLIEKE